jgi:hypothetical protein
MIDTFFSYVKFYLNDSNILNQYENNMIKIYSIVKQNLDEYISNQSEIITNINKSLSKYNNIYDEEIKLDLLEKINKIMKESSKKLIHQYLTNSFKNGSEKFSLNKTTDLSALSSTRLNYTTTVDNTILYYGYNFAVDKDNYKVYLNISANTSVDAFITYQSEYLSTSIAGSIGKGMIGLDLEMDFFNENVKAIYKSEFSNNTVKKNYMKIGQILIGIIVQMILNVLKNVQEVILLKMV